MIQEVQCRRDYTLLSTKNFLPEIYQRPIPGKLVVSLGKPNAMCNIKLIHNIIYYVYHIIQYIIYFISIQYLNYTLLLLLLFDFSYIIY
jgi:hypothetical protein